MIAIDTNVLVRLLTADNASQYKASVKLFAEQDIFIPDSVILETEWVLRAAFQLQPPQTCESLRSVFGLTNVYLHDSQLIAQVVNWHEAGLDFADAFHLSQSQRCTELKTFDTQFIKRGRNLSTCRVQKA